MTMINIELALYSKILTVVMLIELVYLLTKKIVEEESTTVDHRQFQNQLRQRVKLQLFSLNFDNVVCVVRHFLNISSYSKRSR